MKQIFFVGLLLGTFFFSSCNHPTVSLLLEAEYFKDRGGWVTDPQFTEQIGSSYLLAHGYGIPVKDAKATIRIPRKGKYHIWVRTRNWAPGPWEAPGRFTLAVHGETLPVILGKSGASWYWEYAGSIRLPADSVTLTLHDLTGFEGRCDAIFLSTNKDIPPEECAALAQWRKQISGEGNSPRRKERFDVVVVGGGIAGCAAAIAAAEQEMHVALLQDRPVLGGNASSEIRVHTEGIPGFTGRIIRMLDTRHWPNGSPQAKEDDRKRLRNIQKYQNIALYLNWRAYTVQTQDSTITSVDARNTRTGKTSRFTAPVFIDCTGDGWIGYWAGADYMYGREAAGTYHEQLDKYDSLWSPEKPDNRVMGSSVLWRTTEADTTISFPEVPWALEVAKGYAATRGTWNWEYSSDSLDQIRDGEKIRDHLLKAIYGSFYNAKQKPENARLKLQWVSYLLGKRESRRLIGDYVYTFNDIREMHNFPDAIAIGKRPVDVHYQQNLLDPAKPDFLSEALYYPVDHYYIPYRSLYSRNIKNLFMAGRCFSCSHIGLGGPRVMRTTGQMGAATGYAAALCVKYHTTPRGVYQNYFHELIHDVMGEK